MHIDMVFEEIGKLCTALCKPLGEHHFDRVEGRSDAKGFLEILNRLVLTQRIADKSDCGEAICLEVDRVLAEQ